MTRRDLFGMLAAASLPARGQMASRGVTAKARGKASGLPFHASLSDAAAAAGLTAPVIYGGVDRNAYIVEAIGCGVAFLDYDNDGWLDILVLTGTRWEGAPAGTNNRLYKNNRNGTFTDVTKQAGLLHEGNRWGTGCTFVDFDRDGNLDLFVSNYLKFDPKIIPATGKDNICNFRGVPVNCGPRGLEPETQMLYRNNGNGTFTDISVPSGIAKATGSYGLTVVAADFDDDGWPEIYVACDSTPSLFFKYNKDGTFIVTGIELSLIHI